jgi:biopolymer transport protein ExbD
MSYDDQTRSSSSGTVIAIVVVIVLLLLGGLVVLGLAGLYFFRLSEAPPRRYAEPPRAVAAKRAVVVEPRQAVEANAERLGPATTEVAPPGALVRKMTIRLDAQGKILADGQTVDMGGLKDLLVKAREDGTIRLEVVVEVDLQCLFEHVAAVQAVCKEAGVENVRVQALTTAQD